MQILFVIEKRSIKKATLYAQKSTQAKVFDIFHLSILLQVEKKFIVSARNLLQNSNSYLLL